MSRIKKYFILYDYKTEETKAICLGWDELAKFINNNKRNTQSLISKYFSNKNNSILDKKGNKYKVAVYDEEE